MNVLTEHKLEQLLNFLACEEEFVFLDTARPDLDNRLSLLFYRPVRRLQCRIGDDISLFLSRLESELAAGRYLAGWFAYEFGYLLEETLVRLLRRPGDHGRLVADLGAFSEPLFFDHCSGKTNFPCSGVDKIARLPHQLQSLRPSLDRAEYLQAIGAIREYILAGDTYQVNYTFKLLFDFFGSPDSLYVALRRNQSVAYGAYLRFEAQRLLSFSPELFFDKTPDTIRVRPMKGTMRRGRFLKEDEEYAQRLCHDEKNCSENVMIVDLLRNDLGRLMCEFDDVPVITRSLFDVERYETLLQMTSTIEAGVGGERLAGLSLLSLFRALFPCGSVTGAPKIRTMEIINELEPLRRGVYTGAIGYLAPDGRAVFNVPIRTVALTGERGEMGIGSGIVMDSDPEQEWQECLLKGRFLTASAPVFDLIETLLWEPGNGYWLLEAHLDRLCQSADYFLFSCDRSYVMAELRHAAQFFTDSPTRVRLTLSRDGRVNTSSQSCLPPQNRELPVRPGAASMDLPRLGVSTLRVDSSDAWLFHKTTRRQVFDQEWRHAQNQGLFDYCFLNEQGELTEGCISTIILYHKGHYLTPPLKCGLLAGIMRDKLLASRLIPVREKVLSAEDLRQAEAIFCCNSVRGVVRVRVGGDVPVN